MSEPKQQSPLERHIQSAALTVIAGLCLWTINATNNAITLLAVQGVQLTGLETKVAELKTDLREDTKDRYPRAEALRNLQLRDEKDAEISSEMEDLRVRLREVEKLLFTK